MKRALGIFSILFLMFSTPTIASNQSTCEKALLSIMWEDIDKAIDEHYNIEGVQFWNKKY